MVRALRADRSRNVSPDINLHIAQRKAMLCDVPRAVRALMDAAYSCGERLDRKYCDRAIKAMSRKISKALQSNCGCRRPSTINRRK